MIAAGGGTGRSAAPVRLHDEPDHGDARRDVPPGVASCHSRQVTSSERVERHDHPVPDADEHDREAEAMRELGRQPPKVSNRRLDRLGRSTCSPALEMIPSGDPVRAQASRMCGANGTAAKTSSRLTSRRSRRSIDATAPPRRSRSRRWADRSIPDGEGQRRKRSRDEQEPARLRPALELVPDEQHQGQEQTGGGAGLCETARSPRSRPANRRSSTAR